MKRRSTPYQSPLSETEAQRLERLDREAIQTYRDKRFAGGNISKRYYQHKNDEPDATSLNRNTKQ